MERASDSSPSEGDLKLRSRDGSRESLTEFEGRRGSEGPKRFSSTILALQEEREKVLQQFQDDDQRQAKQNQNSLILQRELDDMGKALARSRQVAKQAKRLLAVKEAEVEQLLTERRAILELIIEAGPWALWDWIRKEIVEQGLEPGVDFERRWVAWLAAAEDASRKLQKENAAAAAQQTDFEGNHQSSNDRKNTSSEPDNLLRIVLSIVLQEGMENLEIVLKKGPFFLPMAWFYFWMGLYSRIGWHMVGVVSTSFKRSVSPYGFRVI